MKNRNSILTWSLALACLARCAALGAETSMDQMWGESLAKPGGSKSERVAIFRDGNYGMFIHWGLYSHLGGQWKGQTFYGIGEWIKRQMKIPDDEYMALAKEFNPMEFDAREIARIAKAAGMKYIIITSKHHEGFAMFKSAHPFNIVDATPFKRDPMEELAAACKEAGLGFGFYYSHYQDWTAPGGGRGPAKHADGRRATFEEYFRGKCYPQVKEICTRYGPLNFIWFDTPGGMPKPLVMELADLVANTQPNALLCSRIGHGLGDYTTKGDMEVPLRNIDGLWEACDTTNDSWSYAWYDQNWKDATEILRRLVSTVGRGGSYLLNIGPDGRGRVPEQAAKYLVKAGEWIQRHPRVVYAAGPSPWGHALPWGDVTTQGDTLNLVVFEEPADGRLFLPGLATGIASAALRVGPDETRTVTWSRAGAWTILQLPSRPSGAPSRLPSVIELRLEGPPEVDQTLGIDPGIATSLAAEFAAVKGADKRGIRWMEKFGEWKHVTQVSGWQSAGRATWEVDVALAGDYYLELVYKAAGRTAWRIETDEGVKLQNQQNGASVYHAYPFGLLSFKTPGKHTITVSLAKGDANKASLKAVRLTPAE